MRIPKSTILNGLGALLFLCVLSTSYANAASILPGPGASNIDSDPATLVSFDVLEHGLIQDLNVRIDIAPDAANPGDFHPEDLVIALEHLGNTVQLTPSALGTHSSVFGVTFDDESPDLFPILGSIFGIYKPFQALSAFDGLDVFGTWTLSIFDPFAPGDGATLVGWSLDVMSVPVPGTPALFSLALVGLALSRRKTGRTIRFSERASPPPA